MAPGKVGEGCSLLRMLKGGLSWAGLSSLARLYAHTAEVPLTFTDTFILYVFKERWSVLTGVGAAVSTHLSKYFRQSGDLTTKFESIAVRYQDGYNPPTHKGKLYYTILLYKYLPVSYVYV